MLVAYFFGILLGVVVFWRRYYHTKGSFYPISAYKLGWGILVGGISRFFIVSNIETIRLFYTLDIEAGDGCHLTQVSDLEYFDEK